MAGNDLGNLVFGFSNEGMMELTMRNNPLIRSRILVALAVTITVAMTLPLAADDENKSWQPPPPMPDDFDWVQMTSGEWLKGEIIAMYEESLEFDSNEFDMQTARLGGHPADQVGTDRPDRLRERHYRHRESSSLKATAFV